MLEFQKNQSKPNVKSSAWANKNKQASSKNFNSSLLINHPSSRTNSPFCQETNPKANKNIKGGWGNFMMTSAQEWTLAPEIEITLAPNIDFKTNSSFIIHHPSFLENSPFCQESNPKANKNIKGGWGAECGRAFGTNKTLDIDFTKDTAHEWTLAPDIEITLAQDIHFKTNFSFLIAHSSFSQKL